MTNYKIVTDYNDIELDKHALIEASAGTGKTYTIENLFVKFLKHNDLSIENILVVTFTEKATSELKLRIRENIEKQLKIEKDANIVAKLDNALNAFNTASIFTIHGFCKTILQDFAFESASFFENEVINDSVVFETCLKEQMRQDWHKRYGENLTEILTISNFNAKKNNGNQYENIFKKTVLEIAAKTYHKQAGDILKPDARGKSFSDLKTQAMDLTLKLKPFLDPRNNFSKNFDKLNIHGSTKKATLNKIIIPFEKYLLKINKNNFNITDLSNLISDAFTKRKKTPQDFISLKWNKKGPNPNVCPNYENVIEIICELYNLLPQLTNFLAVQTICQLQEDVHQTKQNHGWISFNDMIYQVQEVLYGNNSSKLLSKLRNKYKIAFVDEFQDTDPSQWKIFKKIFLSDNLNCFQNILYLIGDPKQAIYSFRGADVYAYLDAKNEMKRLSKIDKANLYSLSKNWRSQPELINIFNRLFVDNDWFKSSKNRDGFDIRCQEAHCPDDDERLEKIIDPYSNRPVLNIVDIGRQKDARAAKLRLAKFIANEIFYLMDCGVELKKKDNNKTQRLDFGDICILIRKRSDSIFVEEQLSKLRIPFAYYKKPGLFCSDEAECLSLIFHAILDVGDNSKVKKALLTPFFGFTLSQLYNYEELSASHPVKQILLQWNEYALARNWSLLFQSLMENSGLIFRESHKSGWDRQYANYRQIFEILEQTAYQKNLTFRGLASILNNRQEQITLSNQDADIHQIETEKQKVLFMTMHVSKGLQFPIVFVNGGFGKPNNADNCHIYHEFNQADSQTYATKIVDISCRTGKSEYSREKTDEDKRLFYVALTRTKYKLYLPFYHYEGKSREGPARTLLAPAIKKCFPKDNDDANVLWLSHENRQKSSIPKQQHKTIKKLDLDKLFDFPENHQHKQIHLESFSGMQRKITNEDKKSDSSFHAFQHKLKDDDESLDSKNIMESEIFSDELPKGSDIGCMFHDILENISFKRVLEKSINGQKLQNLLDDQEITNIILKQMEKYMIDEKWLEKICQVIQNTLTAEINTPDGNFILGGIAKSDRLHEIEFYYPHGSNEFMRGFVDLVFKQNEKFYIADWKSNYIEQGYSYEAMETNMNHAGYHLQYKIYTTAVLKWLETILLDKFDPEKHFGGVFYFYLRGMGERNGNGIYYVPPNKCREMI